MNLHIIDIKQQKQIKNMIFRSLHPNVTGDTKSKFSLTEDKTYYEEAHFFTHLFGHTMLYIKLLFGNRHGGTFMLDKTQNNLCINKLYYYEEIFFTPFQKYENLNPFKLMYPCLTYYF